MVDPIRDSVMSKQLIDVRVKARTYSHPSRKKPYRRGEIIKGVPATLLATRFNELEMYVESNTNGSAGGNKHKPK
jgi:hypothetical protein